MHLVLLILGVVFVIGGFVGFALGGIPTIILWALAGICLFAGWRTRPPRVRRDEARKSGEFHA